VHHCSDTRAANRADSEGVEVVAWREDLGVSGGEPVDKRAGLMGVLDDLRAHGAGVLVVSKRDRLARDPVIAAVATKLASDAGAVVRSACGTGNGDSAESMLMARIIDAFSEYERAVIRSRTAAALRAKRARGEKSNARPPYGYRHEGDRTVPHEAEQRTVRAIRDMRAAGVTLAAIVDRLNAAPEHPPRGKRWHPTTVRRILAAHEAEQTAA
jgi:DNA invertase Pin-like site-specific DNA recombinase